MNYTYNQLIGRNIRAVRSSRRFTQCASAHEIKALKQVLGVSCDELFV